MSCRCAVVRSVLLLSFLANALAAEIHLTWNPNPETDLAGYKVYATDLTITNRSVFDVGLQTQATFAPELGHTYLFTVTAYNLAGLESAPSTEVRYEAPAESLAVSWDPSIFASAVEYRLIYGQLNQSAQSCSVGGETSLFVSGLQRGASYYFYVEAFDANQQRIDSWPQVAVLIPSEGPLGALHLSRANLPPQIQLTAPIPNAAYLAPATVLISAAASDLDGSIRSVDFFVGATKIASIPTAPFAFSWDGVAAGTYQISAVATDSSGATTRSSSSTITVNIPPPPAPTALVASSTESSVRLNWIDSSVNETGFRLYRSSGGTFALIATLPANSTEYLDSALTHDTTYAYHLVAYNSAGNSPAVEFSITTKSLNLAPPTPLNVTAFPVSSAIVIGWNPSVGSTHYSVERALNSAGPFTSIGIPQITQWTDPSVTAGTTYFYRVLAVANGVSSLPSIVVASALPTAAPSAPATLAASAAKGVVKLSWQDTSLDETSFIVERSFNGSSFTHIATLQLNSTIFNDTSMAPRRKYFYRVASVNSSGKTFSNIVSVKSR